MLMKTFKKKKFTNRLSCCWVLLCCQPDAAIQAMAIMKALLTLLPMKRLPQNSLIRCLAARSSPL